MNIDFQNFSGGDTPGPPFKEGGAAKEGDPAGAHAHTPGPDTGLAKRGRRTTVCYVLLVVEHFTNLLEIESYC